MSEQDSTQGIVRTELPSTLAPHTSTPIEPIKEGETRWRIYLAWTTPDIVEAREQMAIMLEKAGMDVFPREAMPQDEQKFRLQVETYLSKADASLTLLGGAYGEGMSDDPGVSRVKYQYEQATALSKKRKGKFKRLFWNFPLEGLILEGDQQRFINEVQNNLTSDVMFTTVNNAAQLIQDIRTFLERDTKVRQIEKEYDMAFIANVTDAADCYHVIEKLSEDHKLKTLTVVPDNDIDYRQEASEMILKSKLTVVYFKEASDWAVSFVKQLWKHVGGASSETPFLLIGEDEPRRNRFLRFRAPQTHLVVTGKDNLLTTLLGIYDQVVRTGLISEDRFCPYTGLRPFNEEESIFFKGRERHADFIIDLLKKHKFSMVTGSSGDGKSSLVFAGVLPNLKGGFLTTQYSKWAIASMRPERSPLRNLAASVAEQLRIRAVDEVENALSYGFSALVDLYKKSELFVDLTSEEWMDASEDERKNMKRKASNLLILVDQFEEFFTNVENYREGVASPTAQITVNVLVETVRIAREEDLPIYVVCTMRSDYIGQCVAFRGFAEMIGLATYYVPRLKREEIQEVVEAPASLNGDRISLRLTQRLLNDLGDGIDQLPVLQHCLHQVWNDAEEGKIEMDLLNYAHVGGLSDSKLPSSEQDDYQKWFRSLPAAKQELFAKPRLRNVLNRHANELFATAHTYYNERYTPALSAEQTQDILKSVFICLTKIDENRAVRNRMTLQQIAEIHGEEGVDYTVVGHVVNLFREQGNTFIQPFISDDPESRELTPNTVLDITHESLIRNWERLVEWAEAENKSVGVFNDLKVQVNRWLINDCDPRYLLASGPYNLFSTWFYETQPNPAWIRRYMSPEEISSDQDPLEQSAEYLQDIEFFLDESRRRLNRVKRFRNIAFMIIAGLFVAAIFLAIRSQIEAAQAVKAREQAEVNLQLAEIERTKAQLSERKAKDQQLAARLAALRAEQSALDAQQQKLIAQGEKLNADIQRRQAEIEKERADVERQRAEQQAAIAREQEQLAKQAAFEADKQRGIAIAQGKNALIARDNAYILQSLFLSSLSEIQADQGKPDVGHLLALEALPSQIGDTTQRPYVEEAEAALYYSLDKIINAKPQAELFGHTNRLVSNQFSPDSKQLVTTSFDKTARIWDVKSGREVSVLSGHSNIVERAYFSDDSRYIVTLSEDFSARVWDIKAGRETQALRGAGDVLTHAAMSAGGKLVLTTSADQKSRLYDTQTGSLLATLGGHTAQVNYGTFSPDGKRLITCGDDNQAILWSDSGQQLAVLKGHGGPIRFATFSPSGYVVATVSDDGSARLWNGATGAPLQILRGHGGPVLHCDFSPDGERIATASVDKTARIWEVATGANVGILSGEKGHTDAIYAIEYSSDNLHLLTTSEDRTVRLWDAQAFLRLAVYKGHGGFGYAATFSPDAKLIATAGFDVKGNQHTIRLFEVFDARQALLDRGYSLQKRELTEEEKTRFFLSYPGLKEEIPFDQSTFEDYQQRQDRLRMRDGKGDEPEGTATPGGGNSPTPSAQAGGQTPTSAAADDSRSFWEPAPTVWESSSPDPTNDPTKAKASKPKQATQYHEIKRGDTLWSIAKQYNTTVDALVKMNGVSPNELRPGVVLKVK